MLWNRSLIMVDSPTNSLWSHLLGEAMQGTLKGKRLKLLPGEMLTWEAWRKAHPKTTVLAMTRTHRAYTSEFYKRPEAFVLGWVFGGRPYHASFTVSSGNTVLNCTSGREPLLVTFDRSSTAARLFSRRVGEDVLDFKLHQDNRLRDSQTGTTWDAATGEAVAGPLEGKRLTQRAGIMSYRRAWQTFHPHSTPIQ